MIEGSEESISFPLSSTVICIALRGSKDSNSVKRLGLARIGEGDGDRSETGG
jgi:hypothetical protein